MKTIIAFEGSGDGGQYLRRLRSWVAYHRPSWCNRIETLKLGGRPLVTVEIPADEYEEAAQLFKKTGGPAGTIRIRAQQGCQCDDWPGCNLQHHEWLMNNNPGVYRGCSTAPARLRIVGLDAQRSEPTDIEIHSPWRKPILVWTKTWSECFEAIVQGIDKAMIIRQAREAQAIQHLFRKQPTAIQGRPLAEATLGGIIINGLSFAEPYDEALLALSQLGSQFGCFYNRQLDFGPEVEAVRRAWIWLALPLGLAPYANDFLGCGEGELAFVGPEGYESALARWLQTKIQESGWS